MFEHQQFDDLLKQAIAPAPWYSRYFPDIAGKDGKQYVWREAHEQRWMIVLEEENRSDTYRMAINFHTRVLRVPPCYFGLWFQRNGIIMMAMFDPASLEEYKPEEVPASFYASKEPYFSRGEPVSVTAFSSSLPEGTHSMAVPAEMKALEPILVVDGYDGAGVQHDDKKPVYAIYEIRSEEGVVRVLPQVWFTGEEFDLGYEWITRVIRIPGTDRIIGDGIRIGDFELTADGKNLKEWITGRPGNVHWWDQL